MSEAYVWVSHSLRNDDRKVLSMDIWCDKPDPKTWEHGKYFSGEHYLGWIKVGAVNLPPGECRRFRLVEAPVTEKVQE